MMIKLPTHEEGQGLVEYALILVLIAIVVIAILLQLGSTVSQVYCRAANALQPGSCGVITAYEVKRAGGDLQIKNIAVSQAATVTVTLQDNLKGEKTQSKSCAPPKCSNFSFGGSTVTTGSGVITSDQGDYITFSY